MLFIISLDSWPVLRLDPLPFNTCQRSWWRARVQFTRRHLQGVLPTLLYVASFFFSEYFDVLFSLAFSPLCSVNLIVLFFVDLFCVFFLSHYEHDLDLITLLLPLCLTMCFSLFMCVSVIHFSLAWDCLFGNFSSDIMSISLVPFDSIFC